MPRKAINFDLSTNELKKYFNNTAEAYTKIKTFLLENGFEHSQYSGYISKKSMDRRQIAQLIEKMSLTFTWLQTCVLKFHATDVPKAFDLKYLFKKEQSNIKKYDKKQSNT